MKKSFEEHRQIILDLMNDELYVPMKEKELAIILQVEPEDRAELKAVLNSLLTEGLITISKRGKYTKQDVRSLTGIFISHQKGFGFVEVEGVEEDYFIPAEYTGGAFHQDIVEIALLKKNIEICSKTVFFVLQHRRRRKRRNPKCFPFYQLLINVLK